MNSLRYLVSSRGEEDKPAEDVSERNSVLKPPPAPPPGLIWRLVCIILPVFSDTDANHMDSTSAIAVTPSTLSVKERAIKRKHRKSSTAQALPSIPRLLNRSKRKTLVLDLDETLVHSMARGHHRVSQMVEVHLRNQAIPSFYYVAKRPYCTDFLNCVLQWYEVCIFTASVKEYADPIIDLLERDVGRKCFKRYYRDNCVPDGNGSYIKDLTVLGKDLSRVLLVDNSPVSWTNQQTNGVGIEGWISDPSDRALVQLLPLLYALRHTADVRSVLSLQDSKLITA